MTNSDTITWNGLTIVAYRSDLDGKLCVDIEARELEPIDQHDSGVPDIRINVNDGWIEFDEDGNAFQDE